MARAYRGATGFREPGEPCSVPHMGSTGFAASIAFFAGLCGATQIAVQGRLGDRIGSVEALTCAVVVAGLTGLIVLLVARRSTDGLKAGFTGPQVDAAGGLMSVLVVLAITIAGPKIGVVATTAFLIVGQFTLATRDRPLRLVRHPAGSSRLDARSRARPARSRGGADVEAMTSASARSPPGENG